MSTLTREAVTCTSVSAGIVTALDAVLLELRRDFFTGGFLALDSATTWQQRSAFIVGSLAVDAVCAAFGVLIAQWIASRLRWGRLSRICLSLLCGAAPLALASLLQYEVFARLGDAFDLGLMFDMVGRKPTELLAVASDQLIVPAVAACAVAACTLLLLRLVNRWRPVGVLPGPRVRWWGIWVVTVLLVTLATTMMRTRSDVLDNGLRRKPAGQVLGSAVTLVTDIDRDGYGLLSRPPDMAPFDARVFPYAVDIPGNGIDEDGLAGDLPLESTQPNQPRPPVTFAQHPPVLIVMLESFRADLLGAREGGREVTPVLNRLAAAGGAVSRAFSHNGYTVQSRFHLFTGALVGGGQDTLLDDFRRNGYDTAYFSAQDESFGGTAFDVGTARASHFYDARQDRERRYTAFATAGSLGVSSALLLERVSTYLKERDPARPLFLYVNLYDTHFPYAREGLAPLVSPVRLRPSEILPSRAQDLRRMYANTAANVDRALGDLRQMVTEHVGREPATLVLADHGESLFDEGFLGHGYALNDVQTRIPLVMAGLDLRLCQPVGQSELRQALIGALTDANAARTSVVGSCAGKRVFQYLGTIDRPRQIAFVDDAHRVTYDLRDRQARFDDGAWESLASLSAERQQAVTELVHYWERLRLGKAVNSTGR